MKHGSEKAMVFYFLEGIDYNQSWEKIEYGMGYDLGDYNFQDRETYIMIRRLAKQIWLELQNRFDDKGN